MNTWQVIVGNIGRVYEGTNGFMALKTFNQYVKLSKEECGRVAGETVTLMKNEEIVKEGILAKEDKPDPIGCAIAQRLTFALCLNGIPYQTLADIIYKELREIAEEQKKGDWLELPGGFTYTRN